jgi:hypothetical protein
MFEEKMSLDTTSAISALDVGSGSSYTPASIDSAPVETPIYDTVALVSYVDAFNSAAIPNSDAPNVEPAVTAKEYNNTLADRVDNENGTSTKIGNNGGTVTAAPNSAEVRARNAEETAEMLMSTTQMLQEMQQRDAERYERLMAQNYEFAGINQSGHDWRELAEFQEDAKNREKIIERMMQQGIMDRSRAEQAANKAEELTSLVLQSIMGIISEENRRRLRELENDPVAREGLQQYKNEANQRNISSQESAFRTAETSVSGLISREAINFSNQNNRNENLVFSSVRCANDFTAVAGPNSPSQSIPTIDRTSFRSSISSVPPTAHLEASF